MMEKLDVIDEEDKVTGSEERKTVHEKGLRHRSVMFFVESPSENLLVTKRSKEKDIYPGHWSMVLGGHVRSGMSYEETLKREAKEEIGKIGEYRFITNFVKDIPEEEEYVSLYLVKLNNENVDLLDKEFEEGYFWPLQRIEKETENKDFLPETTTVLNEYKKWKKIES